MGHCYLGNIVGHAIWNLDQLKAIVKVKPSEVAMGGNLFVARVVPPVAQSRFDLMSLLLGKISPTWLCKLSMIQVSEQALLGEEYQTAPHCQPRWLSGEVGGVW